MNKRIWFFIALIVGTACVFIVNQAVIGQKTNPVAVEPPPETKPSISETPQSNAAPITAIPEAMITLKRELQFKDGQGQIALVLPKGTQLFSESTQGLEYIVVFESKTLRVHCDDALENHGRFTDGRVQHLALQMAREIRAEGRTPTNERIVARAIQAVEDRRLEGSPGDLESELEGLQKALLLQH